MLNEKFIPMRIRLVPLAAFLLLLPAYAQQPAPSINPPHGARRMLEARGDGFQIYRCSSSDQAQKWTLVAPDANLLDRKGNIIGRHFAGPTWQLATGGQVEGELIASKPSPDAGSVAWLLLRAKPGTAQGALSRVAYIRRTDTHGGVADPNACRSAADIGKTVRIPYSATYTFYR